MNFVSFEVFVILIVIIVLIKFKPSTKVIEWSLKGVKIYLPPSDKDYDMIIDVKKSKEHSVNSIINEG